MPPSLVGPQGQPVTSVKHLCPACARAIPVTVLATIADPKTGKPVLAPVDVFSCAQGIVTVADQVVVGLVCGCPAFEPDTSEWKCAMCGCSDEHACEGGCSWSGPNLCSKCEPKAPGARAAGVII